jgi:hypothetical protein
LLKPFKKAVIMQDSMSFLKKFDFENYNLKDVIFLWHFTRNLNHHIDVSKSGFLKASWSL